MGKQEEAIKYLYVVINVTRKADKKLRKKIEEEGVPFVGGSCALHSSNLAWRIPQAEEPGGLMGSQRIGHN